MDSQIFKVLINTPDKRLFQALQKSLILRRVEFFYLPLLLEVEPFVKRISPQMAIIYCGNTNEQFHQVLNVAVRLAKNHEQLKLILLYENEEQVNRIQTALSGQSVFILPYSGAEVYITQNILSIKGLEEEKQEAQRELYFEKNLNACLKILHSERKISRIFERLANFLPKFISMDYWALFHLDKELKTVETIEQFVPPTRRSSVVLTHNLEKMIYAWLLKGKAFVLKQKEDPQLFQKLSTWGWPVRSLYFFPAIVDGKEIGGILVGSVSGHILQPEEIRFLNELVALLGQKILDEFVQSEPTHAVQDYSDSLIANRLSENDIFNLTCKNITQITRAHSTIFWQYNKGFGFIFPKYFYFQEGLPSAESLGRNFIFLEEDKFFNRLFTQKKIQSIEEVLKIPYLGESTRNTFEKLGYQNLMIIPVYIHDDLLGLFIVNKDKTGDRFGIWEIQQVKELVTRFQNVLEDAQVVKEARLMLKQFSRIFELGHELTLDLTLDEILKRIAGSVRRSLGWNDVAFYLLDDYKKVMRSMVKLGFDHPLPLDLELAEEIPLKEFEDFLVNCRQIDNSYFHDSAPLQKVDGEATRLEEMTPEWQDGDLLITPIVSRKKVLGYLVVHDPVDRLKPSSEKVLPIEYYANQAAVAVENFVLYEQLHASEARYRSLAETMSLGLVTCDAQSKIIYVNPAFVNLLGIKEKALLGKSVEQFFDSDSRHILNNAAQELLSGDSDKEKRIENVEVKLLSATGETIPVSMYAFPFYQERKKVGFFLVLNDLRLIKRLERMKADFNSMIVHDLRSPMNVIQGFIELIRNRVVGEINAEQEELLDIAKENVKKVLTLIDNFLVASKMEVGKFTIEPKLNEINALIERVVDNHEILLKNKNISLQVSLDKNLPLLFFDSLRIEQVLNNLLSNAMKFTPENGTISVKSSLYKKKIKGEEKFYALISVADTGVGIPADKLQHIFEKYEQVNDNGKLYSAGTGLGLAICKEIVNLHGGEIWVESKEGKGSTFYFTLPIEPTVEKVMKD